MTRRRFHLWTLWLLPLFAARAFVPVGFMLSAQAGGLALTFCPGVMAPLVASDAAHPGVHDEHAHHHDATDGAPNGAAADTLCPFAFVGFAPTANVPQLAPSVPDIDILVPDFGRQFPQVGPHRADRARGPPARFTATIV